MRALLRLWLRNLLRFKAKAALKKHQPKVIAIVGDGETSVAREMIYASINAFYPASRNLETPEAEFSIPLTVVGYKGYPTNDLHWLFALIKMSLQLTFYRSHFHFLIIEVNSINSKVQNYWSKVLDPDLTVVTGINQKIISRDGEQIVKRLPDISENYQNLAARVGEYFDIEPDISKAITGTLNFPESRIQLLTGHSGALVIDSTHYYFPISIEAVLELVKEPSGLVVFSDIPKDLKYLKRLNLDNLRLNPKEFEPTSEDTILLRGSKVRTFDLYYSIIH